MNIFFTSDTHFYHNNIIKYCPNSRGQFSNVEEMNEAIITTWNDKVKNNDIVYHLGDFAFANIENAINIAKQLNRKELRLIIGNHDTKLLKNEDFCKQFSWIKIYNEEKILGENFVMMHFPIASWHRKNYGAIMLHGHCHGTPSNVSGRIKDVGWDTNQNIYNIIEIIDEMKVIPFL